MEELIRRAIYALIQRGENNIPQDVSAAKETALANLRNWILDLKNPTAKANAETTLENLMSCLQKHVEMKEEEQTVKNILQVLF